MSEVSDRFAIRRSEGATIVTARRSCGLAGCLHALHRLGDDLQPTTAGVAFDVRRMTYVPDVMEVEVLVNALGRLPEDVERIAIVAVHPAAASLAEAMTSLLRMHGRTARVFDALAAARAWLGGVREPIERSACRRNGFGSFA